MRVQLYKPSNSGNTLPPSLRLSIQLPATLSDRSLQQQQNKKKVKNQLMDHFSKMGEPLRGFTNVMMDGTKVVTEIVSDHGAVHLCLYLITQKIRDGRDMVIGFDTEWSLVDMDEGRVEARVVLIKLFSCVGCVLIRLDHNKSKSSLGNNPVVCPSLINFFMMKDIVFVGVHVKEDVTKLKENYGIEIRNVVELSDMAAYVLRKPRLVACGTRDLAKEVLKLVGLEQRPQEVVWMSWTKEFLTAEQVECATVDAYVTYKTGKKLLSS